MVGERVARVSKELPGRATLRPAKKVERLLCALDGAAPARAVVMAIVVFFSFSFSARRAAGCCGGKEGGSPGRFCGCGGGGVGLSIFSPGARRGGKGSA